MADPKELIERAEAALEGLGNGSWKVDRAGQHVFEMHDGEPAYTVVQARGWGYLTGHGSGALGLKPAEADAIQGRHMRLIAESRSLVPELNAALKAALKENERLRADQRKLGRAFRDDCWHLSWAAEARARAVDAANRVDAGSPAFPQVEAADGE